MLLLITKLMEKIADRSNAKEYYNSYLKRKKQKLLKRSKRIIQQPKSFESQTF